VILATQEAELRRIVVRSQPWAISSRDPISEKKKHHKKRAGGVAQGVGPEFKPHYWKNKQTNLGSKMKELVSSMYFHNNNLPLSNSKTF
jgi:hypothetical protein